MEKSKKENSIESLPNIGKKIAEKLGEIGIRTADDFLKKDPYKVFYELRKKVDPTLCRCALASIVGAHLGVRWYEITKKTAAEYEKRYPGDKWKNKC